MRATAALEASAPSDHAACPTLSAARSAGRAPPPGAVPDDALSALKLRSRRWPPSAPESKAEEDEEEEEDDDDDDDDADSEETAIADAAAAAAAAAVVGGAPTCTTVRLPSGLTSTTSRDAAAAAAAALASDVAMGGAGPGGDAGNCDAKGPKRAKGEGGGEAACTAR
jgi:hypothetical protein